MPAAGALQTLLLVLPLLLAGAWWAGSVMGRLKERHRLDRQLLELRRELTAFAQLHGHGLVWRCNEQLHVTSLDGAAAPAWRGALQNMRLDAALQAVAAPSLAERLNSRALIAPCLVQRVGDATRWSIAAAPQYDEAGRFLGYIGALAPAPAIADSADGANSNSGDDALSFSYTVSHDLRAPLRVVDGFARILKEDHGAQLDRVGNDHLDRVLSAAARMNQMIDALLAMARLATQPMARQPVDLTQIAHFIVDELRRGAPERQIQVRIDAGMQVLGDPTLLRQVLENLLGNAWKYTQRAAEPSISFTRETLDGRPCMVVRDNGAGFDMRGADRLFGLFQRLHSASEFPGTGVGLASVKRIVVRHGGRIWAEAAPGRGAAFSFTLWE